MFLGILAVFSVDHVCKEELTESCAKIIGLLVKVQWA